MSDAATLIKADSAIEENADWAATITIGASPDEVFDALTTREGLSGWWGPVKGDPTAGGEFTFRPMVQIEKLMRVDSSDRASLVQWTVLECEFLPEWPGTTIRFALSPDGEGGTRLAFEHIGLTQQFDCFEICDAGWQQSLSSLVSYVQTGKGNPF
jgi:uncharacterized protein YndB with AHSA1/START domain